MTIINMSGGKAGKPPVYQARTVQPTQFPTTVQPQEGYDALSQVTVNAPANLLAQNIRKDVSIAGVVGTYEATAPTIKLQQKMFMPDSTGKVITPDEGYDGLSQVMVHGDPALKPENIRKGENIFGVAGTYEGVAPSASTYDWFPTNSIGSFGYPILFAGSDISIPSSPDSYGEGQGFLATGTMIRYTYQRGYWASASGGSCPFLQNSSFFTNEKRMYRVDTSSYNWSNTNRKDGIASVLSRISDYLEDDYFSGTMKCAVAAYIVDNDDTPYSSCLMSYQDADGNSGAYDPDFYVRNVPFTYSNGNVTYTLSTSSSGALGRQPDHIILPGGVQWNSTSSIRHIRLGLMFMGVTVNA